MKKYYYIAFLLLFSSNLYAEGFSFGAGLGVPYGLVGANMNYQINDTFDITAGAGLGFGAGARYHPLSSDRKFRLTAFYGTNVLLSIARVGEDTTETFPGLNFGIGYGAISDGWDFDIYYLMVSNDAKDRVTELKSQGYSSNGGVENGLALSFGYHW